MNLDQMRELHRVLRSKSPGLIATALVDAEMAVWVLSEAMDKNLYPDKEEKVARIDLLTPGQLFDALAVTDIRIWHLIDRIYAGTATVGDAVRTQHENERRTDYERALDARLGARTIGEKLYASRRDET